MACRHPPVRREAIRVASACRPRAARIRPPSGQQVAVRAEGHAQRLHRLDAQAEHLPTRLNVPELHGSILSHRGDPASVRAEGHVLDRRVWLRSVSAVRAPPTLWARVPHFHIPVRSQCGQVLAVGAEDDRASVRANPQAAISEPSRRQLPDPDLSRHVGPGDQTPPGAERNPVRGAFAVGHLTPGAGVALEVTDLRTRLDVPDLQVG
jgi:hypothetical protein